ncbi:TIGR03089 family protein [Arthrobacter sulfonylureivorans]|uniref:TIGR03089 family protein n=1 Tax=Arthrobacter sulfonylureivorans TaxID=2486855 RepID=A0ABY3W4A5_9MICC|nr:TIGR03089 family protein [Arthrobacter sulfonylureivorans]UNK45009.1 TIGR03089 family protein [Arthrobacter sulfonylureivorans]
MNPSASITDLLARLRPDSSPCLVWYGPEGERIELSGRVMDNWVAKTANLLAEELDTGEGTTVGLRMEPHWRSLVWVLAAWQAGATVRLDTAGPAPDVLVSADPEQLAGDSTHQVLVAPGALQLRWPGEVPDGVLDYAAEVRSYADVYLGLDTLAADGMALEYDGGDLTFGQLLGQPAPARILLVPAQTAWPEVLREALATWQGGGTVVLVHADVEVSQRLLDSERVSARL